MDMGCPSPCLYEAMSNPLPCRLLASWTSAEADNMFVLVIHIAWPVNDGQGETRPTRRAVACGLQPHRTQQAVPSRTYLVHRQNLTVSLLHTAQLLEEVPTEQQEEAHRHCAAQRRAPPPSPPAAQPRNCDCNNIVCTTACA
eukprot:360117-Chlamydomonas_euryale.AAC.11